MKLASASIHIARIDGRHPVVVEPRADDRAVARVALASASSSTASAWRRSCGRSAGGRFRPEAPLRRFGDRV
jgi:hypothetical protein